MPSHLTTAVQRRAERIAKQAMLDWATATKFYTLARQAEDLGLHDEAERLNRIGDEHERGGDERADEATALGYVPTR